MFSSYSGLFKNNTFTEPPQIRVRSVDYNRVNKDWLIEQIKFTNLDSEGHAADLFSSLSRLQAIKELDFLSAINGRLISSPELILNILSQFKSCNLFNQQNQFSKMYDGYQILESFSADFFKDDDLLCKALNCLKSHQLLVSLIIIATEHRCTCSNQSFFQMDVDTMNEKQRIKFNLILRIFKNDSYFTYEQLPSSLRSPELQKYLIRQGVNSNGSFNHSHWYLDTFNFFSNCCKDDQAY